MSNMKLLLVILNLLGPAAAAAKPEVLLCVEQPPDQVLGDVLHADQVLTPLQLTRHDLLVEAHEARVHEGRLARQHLVHEDTQGPPVHRLGVSPTLENLRSQVLWGPAHGVAHSACAARRPGHGLSEPEVSEDCVTLGVEEDVLRLEVSVGDVEAVEIREAADNLRGVELDSGWRESVVHPHEGEQLAPGLEGEEEVEVVRVLPALGERYQKRVVDFLNISLILSDDKQ